MSPREFHDVVNRACRRLGWRIKDHWSDVQIEIGPFSIRSTEEQKTRPRRGALEVQPGYTLNGYYLRPKSRSSVEIRSTDVADPADEIGQAMQPTPSSGSTNEAAMILGYRGAQLIMQDRQKTS